MVGEKVRTKEYIMIAGHLQEKNGKYYAVLNCKRRDDSRFKKWVSTGLTIRGNKKRAEKILDELKISYTIYGELIEDDNNRSTGPKFKPIPNKSEPQGKSEEQSKNKNDDGVLFADYMLTWLSYIETEVDPITFAGYCASVEDKIVPYFRAKGTKLKELTSQDLKDYYKFERQNKKGTTVVRYHANIHKALEEAVEDGLVVRNVAHKMRPKTEKFIGSFYLMDEVNELLKAAEGTKLEIAVYFGLFYGLRRSEIAGLKWQYFDFDNDIFSIRHTVNEFRLRKKYVFLTKDKTKTQSSTRSLPLIPKIREKLLVLREKQKNDRLVCGNSYEKKYQGYVYVDDLGNLVKPKYLSEAFPVLLKKHGLRHIRFHDMRHSCASLLLKNGVSLKQIQEWLGHSDLSTTNRYAHLDIATSKMESMTKLSKGFGFTAASPSTE